MSQQNVNLPTGISATGVKRDKHPVWYPPENASNATTGLKVLNSLTETVEPFAPRNGKHVKWYTCGPTVYDVSHMGHARAYLTFDIIRRIMEDYFGYTIEYQMNITDIDDKIIKRARINKLVEDYRAQLGGNFDALAKTAEEAVNFVGQSLQKKESALNEPLPANASSRVQEERTEKLKELSLKKEQLTETVAKVRAAVEAKSFDKLFSAAQSCIGDLLDSRLGATVTDHEIFDRHSRYYERTYFEDMERLAIRPPDVITRVTEYVPQVVSFIEKIVANGFAYKAQSSVFFDTEAYLKAGFSHPKLKPGGDKNTTEEEMAEGEGALSKATEGEKRSPNDFALWKFSKSGEPRWPSPWGDGRPGWHIECSVMASDILGENMDIHAGGWDLKFPHHDNECAQSEAFYCHHQWVNYFFHCGHLHIKGLKMSKSLKNFITIRQALEEITPRQMRIMFLLNHWAKPMNFSDQAIDEVKEKERVLRAFFGSVHIELRREIWSTVQGFNEEDRSLNGKLVSTQESVHAALCDNFDTPRALEAILDLVSSTNQYLLTGKRSSITLLRKIGAYVTRILQQWGVIGGLDDIGFVEGGTSSDRQLIGAMDALVQFRDQVRQAAREKQAPAVFLPMCDALRDELLPPIGIRLEDKPVGPTTWKTDDPVILIKEIADRRAAIETERRKKLSNALDTKRKLLEKWEKLASPPAEYFSNDPECRGKYRAYDESGVPTKDAEGADLDAKVVKKLRKELDKYVDANRELREKGGQEWLEQLRADIKAMEDELA